MAKLSSTTIFGKLKVTGEAIINGTLRANTINASDKIVLPKYPTLSDVPTDLPEGTQVYVTDEKSIYVEDGT